MWRLCSGTERTDHLRVAADAAFADVDVATFQFQGGTRLHAFDRGIGHVLEEQRNDLGQAADADGDHHEDGQQADVLLEYFVVRENVGVYGINQGDLALNSGNYDLSYQGNNLTITKALLNVIADAKTKVYGDADPSLTYQVSGLKNGDTAGAVLNGGSLSVATART